MKFVALTLVLFSWISHAQLSRFTVPQLQGFCATAVKARGCAKLVQCKAQTKEPLISILQINFGIVDIPNATLAFVQQSPVPLTLKLLFGSSPCPKFVGVNRGTNRLRMAYQLYGSSFLSSKKKPCPTPLVLIGGWIGVKEDFQIVAAAFAHTRPVVAVDIRGLGQSQPTQTPGPGVRFDAAMIAKDVSDLISKVLKRRVYVAGQSLGGKIALQLALDYPRLVKAVIPSATVAGGALTKENIGFNPLVQIISTGAYASGNPQINQQLVGLLYDQAFLTRNSGLNAGVVFARGSFYNRPVSGAQALQDIAIGTNFDVSGRLKELRMPVLCLAGDQDLIYLPLSSELTCNAIGRNGKYRELANDGHNFFLSDPAEFIATASVFLAFIP